MAAMGRHVTLYKILIHSRIKHGILLNLERYTMTWSLSTLNHIWSQFIVVYMSKKWFVLPIIKRRYSELSTCLTNHHFNLGRHAKQLFCLGVDISTHTSCTWLYHLLHEYSLEASCSSRNVPLLLNCSRVSDASGVIVLASSFLPSVCMSRYHSWTDKHTDLNFGV